MKKTITLKRIPKKTATFIRKVDKQKTKGTKYAKM